MDISRINQKAIESYIERTQKDNNEDLSNSSIFYDAGANRAIFYETDGDIFYTESDGNSYETELIDGQNAINLLSSGTYEKADFSDVMEYYGLDENDYVQPESSYTYVHRDGTGSTEDRIKAVAENMTVPETDSFKDSAGNISRNKIQKWLDNNGYSSSDSVEGGFNVDDILAYYSTEKDGEEKIYYHLLANEAWLDAGASGDNKVDGKLSSKEVYNFYKDRFGIDITNGESVTQAGVEAWREANLAVGNDVHDGVYSISDQITFVSLDDFTTTHSDWIQKPTSSSSSSSSSSRYDDDYRYNKTLSHSSVNSTSEIKNMLDNLKSTGDFEATITMNQDVRVYDESTGKYKTLSEDEEYDISKITNQYVYVEYGNQTLKLARGTNNTNGFEYKMKNAIDSVEYSANKVISTSTSVNDSDDDGDYKYNNKTLTSSSLDTPKEIDTFLDNLKSVGDYEAEFKLNKSVTLYDEYKGKNVTLSSGKTYDITKVGSNYVEIELPSGSTIKVNRGTSSSSDGFEYKMKNAIQKAVYSADKKISTSTSSSSSTSNSSTYDNYSLTNRSASDVETILDKFQDSDSYDLTLTISNKNWFDEDSNTLVPVGEYQITNITSKYVYLQNEDGETTKIPRGTDEYEFEWYCSKSNKYSTNRITGDYDD